MYRRWMEFQGAANKFRRDTPYVSLNHQGIVWMNRFAFEQFGSPKAVALLYDRANGAVGLRAIDPEAPNAFPVRGKTNSSEKTVCALPFFRHHGLRPEGTVTFNRLETEDDVLVLDLNNVTAVDRRVRRK